MSITRWKPFGEISRVFDDVFEGPHFRISADFAIDLYHEGNSLVAEMSLAGIDPKDTEVDVEEDVLRISARREDTKESKEKNYYAKEIRRGSFERAIRLPAHVSAADTKATFKGGVLKVVMPLVKATQKQKVKVESVD